MGLRSPGVCICIVCTLPPTGWHLNTSSRLRREASDVEPFRRKLFRLMEFAQGVANLDQGNRIHK